MPKFRITAPDGGTYEVTAPDGASQADVLSYAQQNYAKPAAPTQQTDDPSRGMSTGELALAGIGGSMVSIAQGVKQIGAQLGNKLGLVSDDALKQIQTDVDSTHADTEQLNKTGAGLAGNIVGQGAQLAVGGGLLGAIPKVAAAADALRAVKGIGSLLPAAAEGAGFAALQPVATGDSRLGNAAAGGVAGAAGQGIASGIGKVAAGAAKSLSPEVTALAQRAEELGIPIRGDQLVNSKPLNALRAGMDYLPFAGSGAQKEAQQMAFNRAISKTIGEDNPNMLTAMSDANKRLGFEFDRVLKGTDVKATDGFVSGLGKIQQEAGQELNEAQKSVIDKQLNNILSKVGQDDVIPADAAYNAKKVLDRLSSGQDSSLAYYAKQIKGQLMEALNESLGPEEAAKFATTRRQYANMIGLEKVAPKDAAGNVSFANLAGAVKSNDPNAFVYGKGNTDLTDIARIGQTFLKDRVGDSGTAPRLGALGALLGGGAYLGVPGIDVAAGLTAGRGVNAALGSNWLRNYLQNGSRTLQGTAQGANALLPLSAIALTNAARQ